MEKLVTKIALSIRMLCVVLVLSLGLPGCYVTTHVVGKGGTYNGKAVSGYDTHKKRWFLFGAIPLDDVRADKLAAGAKNYTVRETFTFGDYIVFALTLGVAGSRTIRISKSANEK